MNFFQRRRTIDDKDHLFNLLVALVVFTDHGKDIIRRRVRVTKQRKLDFQPSFKTRSNQGESARRPDEKFT